ncbi:flavin-containing monooxygenase [Paenarthrobacter ureafaciens]|uniref:flavin-containing monooxygenase n=1 Tax=Paenarthrobacter ureafaciens TaxID=37931 RepID=UPI001916DB0F|nr:NAD(P)/FAD-dependent oxidoreductase [Paenarthrobacter ureafaciens]QQQ64393.1 NAD(P)/FAD-dependent oxidoreductase [Paenarthrobacter ureafaciens]
MPTPLSEFVTAARASEPAVLAAALAQLTGDLKWADDERLAGLRRWSAGQQEQMDAEGEAYLEEAGAELERLISSGFAGAKVISDPAELLYIARAAIDERLDGSFVPKLEHHLNPELCQVKIDRDAVKRRNLKVTIIGAGMSGIGLAFTLADAGIEYEILDMSQDVGGIWFDNTYPECGVDTQAFQYAWDAEPNLNWTRFDVKRDEILQYIRDAASKRGVLDRIQFGVKAEKGTWDAGTSQWRLDVTRNGVPDVMTTDVLVVAVGSLNQPKIPEIPGSDTYQGETFHTARWRDDLALEGKRVAIIGSGSSGVQVTRSVAKLADELFVFVRSPHWMRPRRPTEIGEVTEGKRWLLRNLPNYLAWYRFYLDYVLGDREHRRMILEETPEGLKPSRENDAVREELTAYIRKELGDREDLITKVTPSYPPYSKRLVVDNGWYNTLTQPNVSLVTDKIAALDETGILTTDGAHYSVDVIGFATGFHGTRYFWPLELISAKGKRLAETFGSDDDLRAYLGTAMADYPNLFALQGPNTAIGHGGGATFMSEGQGRFIMTCLKTLVEQDKRSITIKPEVVDAYNRTIDERLDRMVWTEPGLTSRFRNSAGRVITNHPWTLLEFWERTRSAQVEDFILDPAPDDIDDFDDIEAETTRSVDNTAGSRV